MNPCPHCRRPVPAETTFCPHCGFQILHGTPRERRRVGMNWLMAGLLMCGVAGFTFFFSCIGALGAMNRPSDGILEYIFPASIILGMAGLLVLAIGMVIAIVEAVRR